MLAYQTSLFASIASRALVISLGTENTIYSAHLFSVRLIHPFTSNGKPSIRELYTNMDTSRLMEGFEELDSELDSHPEEFGVENNSLSSSPPRYSRCASPPPPYTARSKQRERQNPGPSRGGDMSYHRAMPDLENGSFQSSYRSGRFWFQITMSMMLLGFTAYATISGAMISWSRTHASQ